MQGLLLVISGPSGVGKGTICRVLSQRLPNVYLSVSATTRAPRPGELDGKDYYFIDEPQFIKMINNNELLEWAKVYRYYYGTPRRPVFNALDEGRHAVLEIDVQGGLQVKRRAPDAVLIFIVPPSQEELRCRLLKRNTDAADEIEERLAWASREMAALKEYDYAVINDRVEDAVAKIEAIITAEQCRVRRFALKEE
ncbi:MAG: guanylate kinase [Peptococcaceae bacterium]|nr:guanylate kinase [Peptococcaceae bacterium]